MTVPAEGRDAQPTPGKLLLFLEMVSFGMGLMFLDSIPAALGIHMDPERERVDGLDLMLASLVSIPLILLMVALYARFRGQTIWDLGLKRPETGWPRTVGVAFLAAAGTYGIGVIFVLATQALGAPTKQPGEIFDVEQWSSRLGLIVSVVLRAGLAEEIIFRGYFLRRLTEFFTGWLSPRQTWWAAAGLSSLLFAIPHGYQGGAAIPGVFVMGIWFCLVVRLCRGNLWAIILGHVIYDTVALGLA